MHGMRGARESYSRCWEQNGGCTRRGNMDKSDEIDAALETASQCRVDAAKFGKGFPALAQWLRKNAQQAERWAVWRAKQSGDVCE